MKLLEKLLQAGGVFFSAGAAATVAYWIYTLSTEQSFWNIPGITLLIFTALGLGMMVLGFTSSAEPSVPRQKQTSGDNSKNYQAGQDMTIGRDHDEV
ncbi:hypothetical protein [Glutamicibacter sp. NPDC090743]|uniref:hypothetical protein n=1 Tax=Glutamicibacter sp. NPDC090743 TaxID=3364001 RepID=UPI003817CDCC